MLIAKLVTYNAGHDWQREYVKANLQLGKKYTVREMIVYSSSSKVYLEGFEESFNSVFFDFYLDGKYIDFDDLIRKKNKPECIQLMYWS